MRPRSGQALGRRDPVGTPGPHSLSVHSPWPLQLEGPQSSSLQAAPRQKCPVHTQRPSTQVPWPLQSGGWQRGSCTHTTVDTCRGQRHMLSWLREGAGGEERPRAGQQVPQVPQPTRAPPHTLQSHLLAVHRLLLNPCQPSQPRALVHAVPSAPPQSPPIFNLRSCHHWQGGLSQPTGPFEGMGSSAPPGQDPASSAHSQGTRHWLNETVRGRLRALPVI